MDTDASEPSLKCLEGIWGTTKEGFALAGEFSISSTKPPNAHFLAGALDTNLGDNEKRKSREPPRAKLVEVHAL